MNHIRDDSVDDLFVHKFFSVMRARFLLFIPVFVTKFDHYNYFVLYKISMNRTNLFLTVFTKNMNNF